MPVAQGVETDSLSLPHDFMEATIHFQDHRYVVAAGAILVAGVASEALLSFREKAIAKRPSEDGANMPLDPDDMPETIVSPARADRRWKIAGFYITALAISAGVLQLAKPYSTDVKTRGEAAVVINADESQDATDMADTTNHVNNSRLSDEITGAVNADVSSPLPFHIYLSGSIPSVVRISSLDKNSKDIEQAMSPKLGDGSFTDGDVLGVTAQNATASLNGGNTILLTTGLPLGTLETSPTTEENDLQNLANVTNNANSSNSGKVSVIIVGEGGPAADISIGDSSDDQQPDMADYQVIFGKKNVYKATTAQEIKDEINAINSSYVKVSRSNSEAPLIASAVIGSFIGGAILIKNRISTLLKRTKKEDGGK